MRNTVLLFIFTSFAFASALQAQPITKSSYDRMISTAEECLAEKDYYNAADWYEKAYEEQPDRSLLPKLAELHYKLRNYRQAERWYRTLLRRDPDNEYMQHRFEYGRVLKMNGKYLESIDELQQFVAWTDDPAQKKLAQNELTGAEMAQELSSGSQGVTMQAAGRNINGGQSEYSPVYGPGGSELYFAKFDGDEVILLGEDNQDYHAKVYRSTREEGGEWGKPEALDENINRPGVHTPNVSFSPDGRYMYLSRVVAQGNEIFQSKLYISVSGEGWSSANAIQGLDNDGNYKHPAAGELFGDQVLFFVSDMDGGYGGLDIYYATIEGEGIVGEAVNLGPTINTAADEITPFYRDGTLYFSSTGHPGIGGYDIFFSTWDGASWSEPVNMGTGYNTSLDDRFFSLDAEGYKGFMTSNREGGGRSAFGRTCCDNIFEFEIAKLYADLVVGVFDNERKPLLGGTTFLVTVENEQDVDSKAQTQENGNRFDYGLELEKAYKVVAKKEGYYPDSVTFNTVGITESKTFTHRFFLKPLPPPEPEYDTITIEEAIVLENILYDFDDDKILPAAESDLQVVHDLMTQYPDMVIELSSHTDNRGIDAYNERLSQRRAESARTWLIEKGIDGERIKAVGYGEKAPQTVSAKVANLYPYLREGDVMTVGYIDSLASEEQQEVAHQINRRTEFKIIKGPTSITIRRASLRKKEANDRNSNIGADTRDDTVTISELSNLYGLKDLKGVPILQFEEREIDFGMVKKGEKREHIYRFTNKGDTAAVISIISACECTTTDYSKRTIEPGETGEIFVEFDSSEKDYAETIDITIILENEFLDTRLATPQKVPVMEQIRYDFDIEK